MDYGSVLRTTGVLAATGFGLTSGLTGQLWMLGIVALIMGGVILVIRTKFRRGKSAEQI